jgi:shikimate kinase
MNIVLIGLMGSGKSVVGRLLAQKLGRPFIDTDEEIMRQAGQTIPAIFAADGEAGFRAREVAVIANAAAHERQVIATGGGAVLDPANRDALRRTGRLVWLDAPASELYRRALAQGLAERPLLSGLDPAARLAALSEERAPAYAAAAHVRIETAGRPPEVVAEEILALDWFREGEGA